MFPWKIPQDTISSAEFNGMSQNSKMVKVISFFKIIVLYYTGLIFYILKGGGQVYPVPSCFP